MQFKKVNKGGVSRDDGVSIQITHPEYLEYRDGDCSVNISMDYDPATRKITVYASQVDTWKVSQVTVSMPQSCQLQMIKDLEEGLALLNGNFVVV